MPNEVAPPMDVDPSSCWGIGSKELPLAPSVLDAFRSRSGRSVRVGYEASVQSGLASLTSAAGKCRRLISEERVQEARDEGLPACALLFGPGVCRTRHELWMLDVLEVDRALWRWTVPRWTSNALEGVLLVRFTVVKSEGCAAPESAECNYFTISR